MNETQGTKYEEEEYTVRKDVNQSQVSNIDTLLDEEEYDPQNNDDLNGTLFDRLNALPPIIRAGIPIGIIGALLIALLIYYTHYDVVEENETTTIEEAIVFEEFEVAAEEETTAFTYSKDEVAMLREFGFTASEIEEAQSQERPAIEVAEEANIAQIKKLLETHKYLLRSSYDSTDTAYTYLLANTYLGLPAQVVDTNNKEVDYITATRTVDYYKMPLTGYQPTVKVRIMPEDRVIYLNVDVDTYTRLNETGNLSITFDYVKKYGCEFYSNIKVNSVD